MSVRAQWAAALVVDDSDPLQNMDIADMGAAIDLSRDSAEIFEEIKASLSLESYLHRVAKISCAIKDSATGENVPCATCPHYRALNMDDPLSRLCQVGREQASLLIEHSSALAAERAAADVCGTLDDELDAALELAEVVLA